MKAFLSQFARVTTSGKFISEIDGLRFIAISTVVCFHIGCASTIFNISQQMALHAGRWLLPILEPGFHGVELFFIISGFILALPFASHSLKDKSPVQLGKYYLRRVTRLEPPYILSMILIFFMLVFIKRQNGAELLPHLFASLVYIHNIVYGVESTINNVAWSLEIEIQFYILVPALSAIFLIKNKYTRRLIISIVCLVSVTYQWLFISTNSVFYLTIVRFIHFFLIGFLLADLYLVDWNEHPQKNFRWDVVSLIGWPLLFVVWNSPDLFASTSALNFGNALEAYAFPVLAFLLYCAAFKGPIANRFFTNPWITTIGGMCYTIYLLHNHLIGLIERGTKYLVFTHNYAFNFFIQSVLIIPPVLIICAIYFAFIEKPCMRKDWPQRAYARVQQWIIS
jgi:peptidoglycan/LPS O-acetylase OafA/YrhL